MKKVTVNHVVQTVRDDRPWEWYDLTSSFLSEGFARSFKETLEKKHPSVKYRLIKREVIDTVIE